MPDLNIDKREIDKFDKVADIWWDPDGEMGTLHTINPLRLGFITERVDLKGKKVLDVGCGGGILSEALAIEGADVTGIDLSLESLDAAKAHAQAAGIQVEYRATRVEDLVSTQAGTYDVVTCMEMLEHVPDPSKIIAACSALLKPGGHAYFSSINRTPKAWLFAIIGGEYILRLLPKGTHNYSMLIKPSELIEWSQNELLDFDQVASLMYNPFLDRFKVAYNKEDVNYMARFIKK